jgi:peptide/nickel transport system substrate-binding protein
MRLWAANYTRRHIWGKWRQLAIIRGFILFWWGIMAVCVVGLNSQINSLRQLAVHHQPVSGGVLREALVGGISSLNPVLPDNVSSQDVNRLIYSGLLRYNPKRQLEPDLATRYEVSTDGRHYTLYLRSGVVWHDGVPFGAQDVAFTLAAIQNPDSRSPLSTSWQGVSVDIVDDLTVRFNLPQAYPPFVDNLTVGLLPRHLLESVDPSHLRVADFNQHPVGTGPYRVSSFSSNDRQVVLVANDRYYGGRPRIDSIVFNSYDTPAEALAAYARQQADSVGQLDASLLDSAARQKDARLSELDLPTETGVFMKTSSTLLQDKALRLALSKATDRQAIVADALAGRARVVTGPLLPGQLGYNAKAQPPAFDRAAATTALEAAGWQLGSDGLRSRAGTKLHLRLLALDSPVQSAVARAISTQWAAVGVSVEVVLVDRDTLQQSYIRPRNYDLLLTGISLGADPDVYSYWHSSQASDPGQNFSVYSSTVADKLLESGRILSDRDVRAGKYQAFMTAWQSDAPAIMLYSPYRYYLTNRALVGPSDGHLVTLADRFYGVEHWTIRTTSVYSGPDGL